MTRIKANDAISVTPDFVIAIDPMYTTVKGASSYAWRRISSDVFPLTSHMHPGICLDG